MQYTLITPLGQIYTFYYAGTAEMFQQAYGGQLMSEHILQDNQVTELNQSYLIQQ